MKKLFLGILLLFNSYLMINAQTDAQVKTLFIYNFIKYIQWPASYSSGDFVIGVLGGGPIVEELQKIAAVKKAGTQTMVVKPFSSSTAITNCHILFISISKSGELAAAITKVTGNSTLIISEKEGLAKSGAGINFIQKDGKLRYELNASNITKYELGLNNDLTKLAIIIN